MRFSIEHQWVKINSRVPGKQWTFHFFHPQTHGNLNAMLIKWQEREAKVRSVSDTMGNDYVSVYAEPGAALYCAACIAGATANCITVIFDQPVSLIDEESKAAEFSGDPCHASHIREMSSMG